MNNIIVDFDPIAFRVANFAFPWYWLVYFLGYFWVYFGLEALIKRSHLEITKRDLSNFMIGGMAFLVLGGRLGYVLIYNPSYYLANLDRVLAIWEGGMSFHGALALSALWVFVFCKNKKISFFHISDSVLFFIPPILFFGRIANFINGELAGRVSSVPWAMVFPRLYDQSPRHPSQLYEAILEGLILSIAMIFFHAKLKVKGFITGLFLIGYGVGRFIVEFFREPDASVGYILKELTMGQLLCLIMISFGIYFINRQRACE